MKKVYYDILLILSAAVIICIAAVSYFFSSEIVAPLVMLGISIILLLISKKDLSSIENLGFDHEDSGKKFIWGTPNKFIWDTGDLKIWFTEYKVADFRGKGNPITNGGTIVSLVLNNSDFSSLIKDEGFEKDESDNYYWKISELPYDSKNVEKLAIYYQNLLKK